MKRSLLATFVLILAASAVQAHFLWIVPNEKDSTARLIFSDNLQPDDPKLLAKIDKTEVFVRTADGKTNVLKWTETKNKDAFQLAPAGEDPRLLGGVCTYGVIQRGSAEPFLLHYYPAAFLTQTAKAQPPAAFCEAWDRLPLQVVLDKDYGGRPYRVLWQGKPLAGAEVVVLVPGKAEAVTNKTDAKGQIELPADAAGQLGIRVRHVEKKEGKHDGKDYKEVRHYATLVVTVALGDDVGKAADAKADPAATKLLAEARAARARWENFPGFTADAVVNFDGKTSKGTVTVEATGKVRFDGIDKEMEPWARRNLASTVSHRLDDSATRNTPCAFTDDNAHHPLGRAIRVLNDELHSSYRIRERQITEVNRQMKDGRFSISVLENRPNAEGKFLSVSFVINYWNLENGELQRSEAHHQTWSRVGKFDLPATTTVINSARESAIPGGKSAQSLTLSNFKLTEGK